MEDLDKTKHLVNLIAKGDSEAFADFYDFFYLKVYRFSSYFVKSDILIEEIVSDVFFNIWQSRKKLQGIKNIEGYLYKATRNRALYYLNHTSTNDFVPTDELPLGYITNTETPESIAETKELEQEITKAVEELPERCKLIYLMAKEEGMKYKEIAEILSISEKTVNAQIVIALKRIAKALRDHLYFFILC